MIRKQVAGQSRQVKKEHLLAASESDTIVNSKKSRAQDYLQRLKNDEFIFSHNKNSNFDHDFVDVVNLSSNSALHKEYGYVDCVINFAYPLLKNQYAVYKVDNKTVGYASWAWFSQETEEIFFSESKITAEPNIVNSGKICWIIDVIAPFGHARQTVVYATKLSKEQGIDTENVKFQRNYTNKKSRINHWIHK
jgi:hemolysin-activating ACP:hemolysin acyltransferase